MQKWKQFALPGEHHDRFEFLAGKWDSTYTIWMEGPDKSPVIGTTVVSSKLIFGGRFLETRMSGITHMEFTTTSSADLASSAAYSAVLVSTTCVSISLSIFHHQFEIFVNGLLGQDGMTVVLQTCGNVSNRLSVIEK